MCLVEVNDEQRRKGPSDDKLDLGKAVQLVFAGLDNLKNVELLSITTLFQSRFQLKLNLNFWIFRLQRITKNFFRSIVQLL